MVSSNLTFLRSAPQAQADAYNVYLKASTPIKQDIYISGPAKVAQLSKLVETAQNTLQLLQDNCNAAETAIRNAALPTKTSPCDLSMHKIKYALEMKLSLQDICNQLVADNDRDSFAALQELVPFHIIASSNGNQATQKIKDAKAVIVGYEKQLMTTDELALLNEVAEVDGCINYVRQNFSELQGFFSSQLEATAVSGMHGRLKRLYQWPNLGTGTYIVLGDDFGGSLSASNFFAKTV